MVMICRKLRLDPIVAVAALYLPSSTGTVSSPIEPFNTMIGQELAGVPVMSGAGVRLIMWFVFVILAIGYSMRYADRIRKDPSRSLTGIYSPDDDSDDSDLLLLMSLENSILDICYVYFYSLFFLPFMPLARFNTVGE